MHSDNIYFAMSALKIGADRFAQSLNNIGFNEELEFPLTLAKSQYASNNQTKIEGETKLADTGYRTRKLTCKPNTHGISLFSIQQ